MAWVDGQEVALHRLEVDVFILPDGSKVDPTRVQLNIPEMMGMTESGQAVALLTKYEPVVIDDERAGFRLRTNHERHVYSRKLKQARRNLKNARNNNNGGEVPHSNSGGSGESDTADRPETEGDK